MGRFRILCCIGAVTLALGGCAYSGPLQDNPLPIRGQIAACCDNPMYVPFGPRSYGVVFERCLDVVDDYFKVAFSDRYDGRIETIPQIAPGLGQPWKPGSPDLYQRLYATLQTVRFRAVVLIVPAHDGGYFIDVKVYKELEDLDRPSKARVAAIFRNNNAVERQYEVIDETTYEPTWIPIGRDEKLEQEILGRISLLDRAEPNTVLKALTQPVSHPK